MEEALHGVHAHNNPKCDVKEHVHADEDYDEIGRCNSTADGFLQKHFGELTMS